MQIEGLADIVRTHSATKPDAVALTLGDRSVTWTELYERARRVATGLRAAGVGSQDRVAFLDKNGIEHFEVLYGAALGNAVCVDVNWRLAPPEVAFIVNDSAAKVLVVGPDFVPVLDALGGDLAHDPLILVIGGHPVHRAYEDWVARPGRRRSAGPVGGGRRRPTVVFQRDHRPPQGRDALQPQPHRTAPDRRRGVGHDVRVGGPRGDAAVPHRWQWMGQRGPLHRCPPGDPAGDRLRRARPPVLDTAASPMRSSSLPCCSSSSSSPASADADFSSLEVIVYGASPISEEVLAASITLFGCRFFQVYGLTETTGAITHLPPPTTTSTGRLRTASVRVACPDPASSCASSTW